MGLATFEGWCGLQRLHSLLLELLAVYTSQLANVRTPHSPLTPLIPISHADNEANRPKIP
jgi:hypothetical protein